MTAAEYQQSFGMPGVLDFHQTDSGLVYLKGKTAAAEATLYLQGAHLTHWQPTGEAPVLFLSSKTAFAPGKAIRGGIPVIWPWFGDRSIGNLPDQPPSPAHGFARTTEWQLSFAALAGDELHLTLTLAPDDHSRSLGYDNFRLAYQLMIGRSLRAWLTVVNDGSQPLVYEEALHTYLSVGDVRQTSITGLEATTYLDKRAPDAEGRPTEKVEATTPLVLTGTTDRVYCNSTGPCVVTDTVGSRRLHVAKTGSASTIVWNPWAELTAKLTDVDPDGWQQMLCVETGNVGPNAVTVAPKQGHTLALEITVEKVAAAC